MKKFLIILFFLGLLSDIKSQIKSIGTYHIENYSAIDNEQLTTTNAIVQDKNGIMYFGNNKGVTLFDGKNWQLLKLPNNSSVNSLASDKNGVVYIGAVDEFGYLKSDANGQIKYESLIPLVDNKHRNIGNVTNVFPFSDGVLFVANNELIYYKNKKCITIQPVKIYGRAILVDNKVLIKENYNSFKIFSNGSLIDYIDSKQFDCLNTMAIIKWKNNSLLAINNEFGCYEENNNKFSLIHTYFTDFVIKDKIISYLTLTNGYTVLGSLHNGAIIIDKQGVPVQHLNKENGLANNHILSLFEDKFGNLWVGHDLGVSFVEISSPFTYLAPQGQGNGFSAKVYQNNLYLGTSQGLFKQSWLNNTNALNSNNKIEIVKNIFGQVWNLEVINNVLYICNEKGTYSYDGNFIKKIDESIGAWRFLALNNKNADYIQGTYSSFVLYEKNGAALQLMHRIGGLNKSCRIFEKDTLGNLWITHGYEGVYRVELNKALDKLVNVRFYGQKKGFPSNLGINVFKIKNKLLFTSEHGGIFEYNQQKDSFVLFTGFEKYFGKCPNISKLYEDGSGNVWFVEMNRTGVLINNGNGGYTVSDKPFSNLSKLQVRGFELIYPVDNKSVILGTANGFLHYNPEIIKHYDVSYNAIIKKVEIIKVKDSLVYGGFKPLVSHVNNEILILPHRYNSLRFNYVAPFYENIEKTKYSCYLEGFDKGWSEWGYKLEREYTNLSGGDYVFHVKAKNIYNVVSNEDTYSFHVEPPFTRTWVAYALYFVLFCLLVAGLVYIYSKKKVAKYRRESIIKEREIIDLKNKQLYSEIEFKNKELGSMTMQMIKRNETLLNIKNKLDEVYDKLPADVKNAIDIIIKSIENDVNADKDWEFLQINFDNVYIGFLKRLKELFPELRSSELQLCAYIRMGLSNKEIATLMNSTVRGIEGYRYRLRKNLNLEHDENIKDFLFNLIQ